MQSTVVDGVPAECPKHSRLSAGHPRGLGLCRALRQRACRSLFHRRGEPSETTAVFSPAKCCQWTYHRIVDRGTPPGAGAPAADAGSGTGGIPHSRIEGPGWQRCRHCHCRQRPAPGWRTGARPATWQQGDWGGMPCMSPRAGRDDPVGDLAGATQSAPHNRGPTHRC